MPSTNTYLDAIRAKCKLSNDSDVARALGVSRQAVSTYRRGHASFEDAVATRAAALLEIHPGTVLLDMHAERSRDPDLKNLWSDIGAAFLSMSLPPPPRQLCL